MGIGGALFSEVVCSRPQLNRSVRLQGPLQEMTTMMT
jgi:hypothetical protein